MCCPIRWASWPGRLAVPSSCRFGSTGRSGQCSTLTTPAERNVMYERVIREATQADDLRSYLNEAVLRRVWRLLF